jgi:predicted membrane protein
MKMDLLMILKFTSFFFLSLIFPILLILFVTKKIPKTYLKKVQKLFYPILFFIRDLVLNFSFFTLGITLLILNFFTEKISSYIRCRKEYLEKRKISENTSIHENRIMIMNDNKNENEIIGEGGLAIGGNNRDKLSLENDENCARRNENHSGNDAFDLETVFEEDPFEGQTMDEVSKIKI